MKVKTTSAKKNVLLTILSSVFVLFLALALFVSFTKASPVLAVEDGIHKMDISISDDITVRFYTHGGDRVVCQLGTNEPVELTGTKTDDDGYTIFSFGGVAPQYIGTSITATLYNGETQVGDTITKSVKEYLTDVKSKQAANEWQQNAMIDVCNAMLNYGTAAQTYLAAVNSETLADNDKINNGLGIDVPNYVEDEILSTGFDKNDVDGIVWKGAGLRFDYALSVYFVFEAESVAGLTATIGDDEVAINVYDAEKNQYIVRSSALNAAELLNNVTVKIGEASCTYGIKQYAKATFENNNSAMANLVKAAYAYGKAAHAYAEFGTLTLADWAFNEENGVATYDDAYGYKYEYTASAATDEHNNNAVITWTNNGVQTTTTLSDNYIVVGGFAYSFANNNFPEYVDYENNTFTISEDLTKPVHIKGADLVLGNGFSFTNNEAVLSADPISITNGQLSIADNAQVEMTNKGDANGKSGIVTTGLNMGNGSTLTVDGFDYGIYMNDSITIEEGRTIVIKNSTNHAIGCSWKDNITLTVNGTLTATEGEHNDVQFINNNAKAGAVVVNGELNAGSVYAKDFTQNGGTVVVNGGDKAVQVKNLRLYNGEFSSTTSATDALDAQYVYIGTSNGDSSNEDVESSSIIAEFNGRVRLNDGANAIRINHNNAEVTVNGQIKIYGDKEAERLYVRRGKLNVFSNVKGEAKDYSQVAVMAAKVQVGSGEGIVGELNVKTSGADAFHLGGISQASGDYDFMNGSVTMTDVSSGSNASAIVFDGDSNVDLESACELSVEGYSNAIYSWGATVETAFRGTTNLGNCALNNARLYLDKTYINPAENVNTDGYVVLNASNLGNRSVNIYGDLVIGGSVSCGNIVDNSDGKDKDLTILGGDVSIGTVSVHNIVLNGGTVSTGDISLPENTSLNVNGGSLTSGSITGQQIFVNGGNLTVNGAVTLNKNRWGIFKIDNAESVVEINDTLTVAGNSEDDRVNIRQGKLYLNSTQENHIALTTAWLKVGSDSTSGYLYITTSNSDAITTNADNNGGSSAMNFVQGFVKIEKTGSKDKSAINMHGVDTTLNFGCNVVIWNFINWCGSWSGNSATVNFNNACVYGDQDTNSITGSQSWNSTNWADYKYRVVGSYDDLPKA